MILVTGATGTTGSEVVRQLAAAGVPVRAFVRSEAKAAALHGPGVAIAVGDLDRPQSLEPALEGVRAMFLLTAVDPHLVEHQGRAVEAAQRAGVQHVVKLSALGAHLDSPVSLLRWHGQTERLLEESGLAWTHLRPHFFMQNTLGFAPRIAAEGRFDAPMRDGKIGIVDTRDIAAVAVAVLTKPGHAGKAYDITGPEALSFADLAACIAAATGRPVRYVDVPPSEAEKAMIANGMPEWLADALVGLYGIFGAGHASKITTVVQDVAGKPARTYAQFAREHARAFGGG
jgi:uncharacterized protein YbjT (DUF2867 family)